jgi:hypothetical protein
MSKMTILVLVFRILNSTKIVYGASQTTHGAFSLWSM